MAPVSEQLLQLLQHPSTLNIWLLTKTVDIKTRHEIVILARQIEGYQAVDALLASAYLYFRCQLNDALIPKQMVFQLRCCCCCMCVAILGVSVHLVASLPLREGDFQAIGVSNIQLRSLLFRRKMSLISVKFSLNPTSMDRLKRSFSK